MTDITIPTVALEAAARAAMKDNGCGYTVNGRHVLCDDPVCEGLLDPYGRPLKHECSCRSMACAACQAMLKAWPGMEHDPGALVAETYRDPGKIILPLQEKPND